MSRFPLVFVIIAILAVIYLPGQDFGSLFQSGDEKPATENFDAPVAKKIPEKPVITARDAEIINSIVPKAEFITGKTAPPTQSPEIDPPAVTSAPPKPEGNKTAEAQPPATEAPAVASAPLKPEETKIVEAQPPAIEAPAVTSSSPKPEETEIAKAQPPAPAPAPAPAIKEEPAPSPKPKQATEEKKEIAAPPVKSAEEKTKPLHVPSSVTPEEIPPKKKQLSQFELKVAAQKQLARLGCYRAKIDGIWGPKSRAALRNYNRWSGNDVGRPNQQILVTLQKASKDFCTINLEKQSQTQAAKKAQNGYIPPRMKGKKLTSTKPNRTVSSRQRRRKAAILRRKKRNIAKLNRRRLKKRIYRIRRQERQAIEDWGPENWPRAD